MPGHWASGESAYGMSPQTPSFGVAAPTATMGTDDIATGWKGLVDPHNPLMWLGVVVLVTFGAASVAGSVRVGKATFRGSIGQSEA